MDFQLTEDQKLLRDGIIRFARQELNEGADRRDREASFDRKLWRKCGGMGLTGLPVPPEFGGAGLDSLSTAIALEALGYGCEDGGLVFSISAHLLACVVPVVKFGTPEQRQKYLPGMSSGELIGVNALTEPGSGSDVFAMTTRAERHAEGFRINGTKTFASNGPVADVALIFAVTDPDKGYHGGITAFLVETATPGLGRGRDLLKMGLRSSPMCELTLEDVVVSDDAILGGVGGGTRVFTHSMDWERACLFASHIGTMQRLLEKTVEYARTRSQSGRRISEFQAVAHRIADMKVGLEAARLLVFKAAWALEHSRTASLDSACAKLFASEAFVDAARSALQVHGGYGFMTEFSVERVLRDALGSTIYSGTSEIQRNIVARWLGLR